MKKFRYASSGHWFKGNVHIHSVASDGGQTFEALAERYAGAGYSFLFRTDHWVGSDVASDRDPAPLLWLDGVELDGRDDRGAWYHVVCLGKVAGLDREQGFQTGLDAARAQGALLIVAHPHWCGNSPDDCLRQPFHGVEVYNHVCRWLNGKSDGLVHWDAMLRNDPGSLAFAVDDAHLSSAHPGWNGGWIMVNAAACTESEIMAAIRAGNFYSSCGPRIESLEWDGRTLRLRTSPIQFARIVGPASQGIRHGAFDDSTFCEVSFSGIDDWAYAYLEIEDQAGRRAWTNNLFVGE